MENVSMPEYKPIKGLGDRNNAILDQVYKLRDNQRQYAAGVWNKNAYLKQTAALMDNQAAGARQDALFAHNNAFQQRGFDHADQTLARQQEFNAKQNALKNRALLDMAKVKAGGSGNEWRAILNRQKIANDPSYGASIPNYNNLSGEQQDAVKDHYGQTGQLPTIDVGEEDGMLWGKNKTYTPRYAAPQTQTQTQSADQTQIDFNQLSDEQLAEIYNAIMKGDYYE